MCLGICDRIFVWRGDSITSNPSRKLARIHLYCTGLPRLYKTFAYLDSALEMIAIRSNRNWKIRHARFELKTKSLCTQCYSWNALELIFFGSRNAERDKARPKNILDIGMSFAYPDVR